MLLLIISNLRRKKVKASKVNSWGLFKESLSESRMLYFILLNRIKKVLKLMKA